MSSPVTACSRCQRRAAVTHVRLRQLSGRLIINWLGRYDGELCRPCLHRTFLQMTGHTLVQGWWSITGLVLTPLFIAYNVWKYLGALGRGLGAGRHVGGS